MREAKKFTIKRVTRADGKTLAGFKKLLAEWSSKKYPVTAKYYSKLFEKSVVLVAYDNGEMVGMVTLVPMHKLSGLKGSLEHLMVQEKYRGQGLGKQLVQAAIGEAKKLKITSLFLTVEPDRLIAQGLYKKLGFKKQDTQFYQLKIT